MSDELPTARSTLAARYVRVRLDCRHCRHTATADLARLVAEGRGDAPLTELRWRCAECGANAVDAMVVPVSMRPTA
jgi:hypothetical protein